MQYGKGTPINIVDNANLALILNGALLLDQGFVFNSIDPKSLVEYANQTAATLSKKKKKYEDVVLDNNSLKVDPREDAYISTDDPEKAGRNHRRENMISMFRSSRIISTIIQSLRVLL